MRGLRRVSSKHAGLASHASTLRRKFLTHSEDASKSPFDKAGSRGICRWAFYSKSPLPPFGKGGNRILALWVTYFRRAALVPTHGCAGRLEGRCNEPTDKARCHVAKVCCAACRCKFAMTGHQADPARPGLAHDCASGGASSCRSCRSRGRRRASSRRTIGSGLTGC